jgi:hypothetical protein
VLSVPRLTVAPVMFEPRAQNEMPVYAEASTGAVVQKPEPRQLEPVMVTLRP